MKPHPKWLLFALPLLLAADSGPQHLTVKLDGLDPIVDAINPQFIAARSRYQITHIPGADRSRGLTVLLDTTTGRAWEYMPPVKLADKMESGWLPMSFYPYNSGDHTFPDPASAYAYLTNTPPTPNPAPFKKPATQHTAK